MTVVLIDPCTAEPLVLSADQQSLCSSTAQFPIKGGIPRICNPENYSESFGFQWGRFAKTQIDREQGQSRHSERRLFLETGWTPADLDGVRLLEVGSGAGRFSRVILEQTNADLWSVDYSTAVESNLANNASFADGRLHLVQASIYEMPFRDDTFDKVLCLGVLQHTPDFEASVRALIAKAKPGGEIVVDFYHVKGFWTKIHSKYILRPMTTRMGRERLLKLIERHIDRLIRIYRMLEKARLGPLTRFVPICGLRALPPELSEAEIREWAILDTFDMFSPTYDRPQKVAAVAEMFRRNGAEVTFAGLVAINGTEAAVVRAVKPKV
jgi:SAM-dependent methyltransferase